MSISKLNHKLALTDIYATDGDEVRRVDDQSLLMQNIKLLTNSQTLKKTLFIVDEPTAARSSIMVSLKNNSNNIGTEINNLFNFKDFIQKFNNFKSSDLSALVPYIQIYKLYPDEKQPNKKIKQIIFNNFYPKEAIQSITGTGSDRGFQGVLKSLQLNSQGKDPATMYLYDLKFKFSFDSIGALFDEQTNYTELFNPPKNLQAEKRRDANPKYYRLYLKFGWTPNTIVNSELKSFCDSSKGELFINYIKHNLNIQEDGSVDLDVEYIGSLDAEARDQNTIDIIKKVDVEKLKSLDNIISSLKNSLKERYPNCVILENQDPDTKQYEVKFTNQIDGEEIDDPNSQEVKKRLEELLTEKYKTETTANDSFLNEILNNIINGYNGSLPVLTLPFDNVNKRFTYINEYNGFSKPSNPPNTNAASSLLSDKISNISRILAYGGAGEVSRKTNQRGNAGFYYPKDLYEYLYVQDEVTIDSQGIAVKESKYNIYYFTFGAFLRALELNKTFLIIGNNSSINYFTFDNVKSASTINVKYNIEDPQNAFVIENKLQDINIFDIPISLSTFKSWFNRNITSQKLSNISLNKFLNLCVNDLLFSAIQPTNDDFFPQQNIKFKYFYDRVRINKNNKLINNLYQQFVDVDVGTGTRKVRKFQLINEIIMENNTDNIKLNSYEQNDQIEEKNVIIFYSTPKFFNRVRNYENDLKDGIPSFYYGNKNNILNKITFKESTIPYLKESSIQKQVKGTEWKPGILLRGLYNVTLESIGLTNFRPGSIIYVAPTFTGIKNINDALNIGIGGYFMIVSLNISIESGKYTTNIEGMWIGDGTGVTKDLQGQKFKLIRIPSSSSSSSIQTPGIISTSFEDT